MQPNASAYLDSVAREGECLPLPDSMRATADWVVPIFCVRLWVKRIKKLLNALNFVLFKLKHDVVEDNILVTMKEFICEIGDLIIESLSQSD